MTSSTMQQNTYDQYADEYARWYAEEPAGAFHFNLEAIIPRLLEVVGSLAGLTVLDAGCGEGIVSRLLAAEAAYVTGIDISPRLIAYAQERDQTQAIRYEVADLSQPLPHYTETFDLVVSNLVLNDVPDYQGFIATIGSVLKPGGRFVLSMNNPYSALIREKVDDYFDSGKAVLYNMARHGVAVYYYHRTMEEYLTAFRQESFLLSGLYDLQIPEAMVARLPERNREFPWFSLYARFPFMVVLDLVKVVEAI
jgi:2-polyprenyl-3-methyl-5-hydroxy-6-metoxy-1,4-benzoquinol methylase